MDIYEARRLAVLELIRSRFAGKQVAFVEATGIPASYVSRMLKQPGEATRKRIGEDIARKIEDKLGLKADAVVSPISQMGAYAETLVAQSCPSTGKKTGACPGWQVDHRIAMMCGGPDTVDNLQWLTVEAHRAKTRVERRECRSGRVKSPQTAEAG